MRLMSLAGIVLMGLGAFLLIRGFSYSSREKVLEVGGVELSAERQHTVPLWVGGVVAVVGLGLVIAGTRSRR